MTTDCGVIFEGDLDRRDAKKLGAALNGFVQADAPVLFETAFLSGEEIRALNRTMRGVDEVTDVLSFPAAEDIKGRAILEEEHGECLDEEGRLVLGSIAVCTARAREQAAEYGHSFERELNYLVVHGALHCLGYDHNTEEERAEMRAKEEEIMKKLGLERV